MTCHANKARADLVRSTWLPRVPEGIDAKFFLGWPTDSTPVVEQDDSVWLDAADDYKSFPRKVLAMLRWAEDKSYERIWKVDDDVYAVPERLKWEKIPDYLGRKRGPSYQDVAKELYGPAETSFCSGFGYSLNRNAIEEALEAQYNGDWAEDRFIGNALARAGIRAFNDPTVLLWPFTFLHSLRHPQGTECPECVAAYSAASIICPHQRSEELPRIHEAFMSTGRIPPR
jgi:hypothetical protein